MQSHEKTITYLEMLAKPEWADGQQQTQAQDAGSLPLHMELIDPPDWQVNAEMYRRVGAPWNWKDRLIWKKQQWQHYVAYPVLETRLGYHAGKLIGYAELDIQPQGNCHLVYFGLLPEACGKGLGKQLLQAVIGIAWSKPATQRLWLSTCSTDHPSALHNYIKRGFTQYRVKTVHLEY